MIHTILILGGGGGGGGGRLVLNVEILQQHLQFTNFGCCYFLENYQASSGAVSCSWPSGERSSSGERNPICKVFSNWQNLCCIILSVLNMAYTFVHYDAVNPCTKYPIHVFIDMHVNAIYVIINIFTQIIICMLLACLYIWKNPFIYSNVFDIRMSLNLLRSYFIPEIVMLH